MKKLFVCALAVGLFTACSQDETISQQSPMQISFEGAFVNNASRADVAADPSTTTATLKAFDVWAYMDQAEGLFLGQNNGENVTGEQGNFTYVNTAYWNPGHTYYFHALAPMDSKNATVTAPTTGDALGLTKVAFTNEAGTEDLLYSTYKRTIASGKEALKDPANTGTVHLTFSHLLSKVKFSFKNTYTNENIHFEVKDIEMTAPKTGEINLNNADWKNNSKWTVGTEDVTLAFGTTGDIEVGDTQESADERLTIPATETEKYVVTFNVLLYNGDVLVNEIDETTKEAIPYQHDITLDGFAFEIGKAYDLYAELNADNIIDPNDPNYDSESYPIVFDVQEVEKWDYSASDALGEDYIVEKGEEFMLVTDITVEGTLKVNSGILNGAGNTVYAEAEPTDNGLVRPTGEATIKDVTINGKNTSTADGKSIRGIYITSAGTYTIDNVTIKNVTYAINVNTTAEVTLNVTNSTLEGWTSFGSSTTASFTNVKFECGKYANFKPYTSVTLTDCSFEDGFMIDFTSIGTGVITFKNCTYNGTVLTAENFATTVTKIDGTPRVAF